MAWKASEKEDRFVRATMPEEQVTEFNQYVDLMNGANQRLGPFLVLLLALVQNLDARFGWLLSAYLWEMREAGFLLELAAQCREPLTESEFAAIDKRDAFRYEMFPESERERVTCLRDERAQVRAIIERRHYLDGDAAQRPVGRKRRRKREPFPARLQDLLLEKLREALKMRWSELMASEQVLAEVADEFDGESASLPEVDDLLRTMRAQLLDLQGQIEQFFGEKINLPEADPHTADELRTLVGPGLPERRISSGPTVIDAWLGEKRKERHTNKD
jgi:hypothetical protein